MCGVLTAPLSVEGWWFVCMCVSFFFLFFPFWFGDFCICLYHRCCQGRRVVFSHTQSSTKTTQAVRMNWTSSSMEESSSSLSYWTLWVKYIFTKLLSCTLGYPFNWWRELYRGKGERLLNDSCSDDLFYTTVRASSIGINKDLSCFVVLVLGVFFKHLCKRKQYRIPSVLLRGAFIWKWL